MVQKNPGLLDKFSTGLSSVNAQKAGKRNHTGAISDEPGIPAPKIRKQKRWYLSRFHLVPLSPLSNERSIAHLLFFTRSQVSLDVIGEVLDSATIERKQVRRATTQVKSLNEIFS